MKQNRRTLQSLGVGICLAGATFCAWGQTNPPSVTTTAADALTGGGATLHGTVNPNGFGAASFFQYSTDPKLSFAVTTIAGGMNGRTDYADGIGTNACFNSPEGLAVDAAGNIYVADVYNYRIRKVTPEGVVSTLAGSGNSTWADGHGTNASFGHPSSLALDRSNNLYVADGRAVRKVTLDGDVTTVVSWMTEGFFPIWLALDAGGMIYALQEEGIHNWNWISTITPQGAITDVTYWRSFGFLDGTITNAQFYVPRGIALDGATNIYLGDTYNGRIRQIALASTNKTVSTLAGSGLLASTDGVGTNASFYGPWGVAVDPYRNVYVAEADGCRIRRVTASGVVTTIAGSVQGFADGPGAAARFYGPLSVTLDNRGNLYVSDVCGIFNRIRKLAPPPTVPAQTGLAGSTPQPVSLTITNLQPETTYYYRAAGTNAQGWNEGLIRSFTTPSTNAQLASLGVSAGLVAPSFNSNLFSYAVNVSLPTVTITAWPAQTNATVAIPGSRVASGFGALVSLSAGTNTIPVVVTAQDGTTALTYTITVVYTPLPAATTLYADSITTTSATLRGLVNPNGPAADAFFQDLNSGQVSTLAGASASGSTNAQGTDARFYSPMGLALDNAGTLYVADAGNNQIRKVAPDGTVSTLAGAGVGTFVDGPPRFYYPQGVAVDVAGTVFVADSWNNRIRKVTASGTVTTLAGWASGTAGFADGPGSAAKFNVPTGVAVDGAGCAYVADCNNHRIRKITPAGEVSTFAGTGIGGWSDGPADSAMFRNPRGIAIDPSGNILVADTGNNRIRRITPDRMVSTLAGSGSTGSRGGQGGSATFDAPWGVSVDPAGHIYVADSGSGCLRELTANGWAGSLAGWAGSGFADGFASSARFSGAVGMAVDAAGCIYVGDSGNNRIRKVVPAPWIPAQSGLTGSSDIPVSAPIDGLQPASTYSFRTAAVGASGTAHGAIIEFSTLQTNAQLAALSLSTGSLNPYFRPDVFSYTALEKVSSLTVTPTVDQNNATVAVNGSAVPSGTPSALIPLTSGTNLVTVVVTAQDGVTTQTYVIAILCAPTILTVPADGITSTAATLHGILDPKGLSSAAFFACSTDPNPGVSTLAGSDYGTQDGAGGNAMFTRPVALSLDCWENLYVADLYYPAVRKVTLNGEVTTLPGADVFWSVAGVAVDAATNVFVADADQNLIWRITPEGGVNVFAGSAIGGFADGSGTAARFRHPSQLALDRAGNVIVADAWNHRIRRITPGGLVTTLAGSGAPGMDNGPATVATFNNPAGVAIDAQGNVFVADYGNQAIRRIATNGLVSTLAGSGSIGSANGPGASATFSFPTGVAVDNTGTVFVADSYNHLVRKITPDGYVTTVAGSGVPGFAEGLADRAYFSYPSGLVLDGSGVLYVADSGNQRIRKIAPTSVVLAQDGLTGPGTAPIALTLSNLLPATTYYFQALATNFAGTDQGALLSFTTLPLATRLPILSAGQVFGTHGEVIGHAWVFTGMAGHNYEVQTATSLQETTSWATLAGYSNLPGVPAIFWTNYFEGSPNQVQYYRVRDLTAEAGSK